MTRIVVLLEKLLFKSLLPLITFVNCKSSYLVKGFLRNLSLCFDVACAKLWVNARARNFFLTISVAKCCLVITDVHRRESKKQVFRVYLLVKLAYGRILIIKENESLI